VVFQGGSPATRWKRASVVRAMAESGCRIVVPDRPGYGGSTRSRGRRVADVARDVETLVDTLKWNRFAVSGGSGGGPHALACAALLGDRVTRCAVVSGITPPLTEGPRPSEDAQDPRRNVTSWLAARGEDQLRQEVERVAASIMAGIEAGGPEMLPDLARPCNEPPAKDSPESMARLRATFQTSQDGWVDDNIAFAMPWGFDISSVTTPVGVWWGNEDARGLFYAQELLAQLPDSSGHDYVGGHLQPDASFRQMLAWLRA